VFGFGFLVDDVKTWGCFAVIMMTSSICPKSRYCGSKFHWMLGENTSLWSPWSTF